VLVISLTIRPWRWRQYVPPNYSTRLLGVRIRRQDAPQSQHRDCQAQQWICDHELLTQQFYFVRLDMNMAWKFIFILAIFSVSLCRLFLRKLGHANLLTHGTESFLLLSSCLFLHETHVHMNFPFVLRVFIFGNECGHRNFPNLPMNVATSVVHTSNNYFLCQLTYILERYQSYRLPLPAAQRLQWIIASYLQQRKEVCVRQSGLN
jgi:hypothetical protein